MTKYTPEMIEYLKEITPGTPIKEVTKKFNSKFNLNIKFSTLWATVKRHKISNGRDTKFKKGQVAFNKGKSFYAGGKSILTQFKKGNIPANYKPIGSECITVDGYTKIKIGDPNKWISKHIFLYEKAYGKVPKGSVIIFADGDKSNFNLDNLLCITRAQLAVMNKNKLIYSDTELTKTGLNIAKIKNEERIDHFDEMIKELTGVGYDQDGHRYFLSEVKNEN